jgi:hypothetical protein
MQRTQIYLDVEQHQTLVELAARQGISLAELMRRIVDEYLQQREQFTKPDRGVYFRLVGLGASGRSDVSEHHDRYLGEVLKNDRHG